MRCSERLRLSRWLLHPSLMNRPPILPAILAVVLSFLSTTARLYSAEARLRVAPRISLPQGIPTYSEELMNFYGIAIEALRSAHLRERLAKSEAATLAAKDIAAVRVDATQLPGTSILLLKATGPDDTICAKFLSALVREFLLLRTEQKKAHYEAALTRVAAAIINAGNDEELKKALTEYQKQLRIAASLDTQAAWEPEPGR